MTNDNELFELCRKTYEATGWTDIELGSIRDDGARFSFTDTDSEDHRYAKGLTALYTSDYLLEKLPEEVDKKILVITNGDRPHAGYAERNNYGDFTLDERFYRDVCYSNEVRKALLELTLRLAEEGLL